jgi:hypothetical protein
MKDSPSYPPSTLLKSVQGALEALGVESELSTLDSVHENSGFLFDTPDILEMITAGPIRWVVCSSVLTATSPLGEERSVPVPVLHFLIPDSRLPPPRIAFLESKAGGLWSSGVIWKGTDSMRVVARLLEAQDSVHSGVLDSKVIVRIFADVNGKSWIVTVPYSLRPFESEISLALTEPLWKACEEIARTLQRTELEEAVQRGWALRVIRKVLKLTD